MSNFICHNNLFCYSDAICRICKSSKNTLRHLAIDLKIIINGDEIFFRDWKISMQVGDLIYQLIVGRKELLFTICGVPCKFCVHKIAAVAFLEETFLMGDKRGW